MYAIKIADFIHTHRPMLDELGNHLSWGLPLHLLRLLLPWSTERLLLGLHMQA